jgi:hypothetical protein
MEYKFIIENKGSITLISDLKELKNTIIELKKSNDLKDIICHEVGKRILIRELF